MSAITRIFTANSSVTNARIKHILVNKMNVPYKCNSCSVTDWPPVNDRGLNHKMALELEHINGINNDNRINNLELLCPNCHSCTSTYKGRNKTNCKAGITNNVISCLHCNVLCAPPLKQLYARVYPVTNYINTKCVRKWIKLYESKNK